MISELSQTEIQKFIQDHLYDDPAALMLQASRYPEMPMAAVVEQIQSKRKAKSKLPDWFATSGIIYPPRLSMEQCSSQLTAEYKASLVSGKSMVDLTGGLGVDSYYLSKGFEQAHYVERSESLTAIAAHNFKALNADNLHCHHGQGEDFLKGQSDLDLIYLDPARRGSHNEKVVRFQDCEPDVVGLLSLMQQKAGTILIKASPMLDIKGALNDLQAVSQIHVVAVQNEVKELLFLIDQQASANPSIHCINLGQGAQEVYQFDFEAEVAAKADFGPVDTYLYEPNAAILKAGAFRSVGSDYGLVKLHANTHLYTSREPVEHFPGRVFKVLNKLGMNKKELRKKLPAGKANITVRNFPMTVAQIRKKTGLKEGGNEYLIATQDTDGPKIFHCQRV